VLTALAAAPWFPGPGVGFPFFFVFPLIWLILLIVVVVLIARGARRRWETYGGPAFGPNRSPEATVAERFAKGEIDEVEYRARLEVLRANRPQRR
jgi:putative membrane protein